MPTPISRPAVRATLLCAWLVGCAADPSQLEPTEALTAFLAAMERSTHAPDQRRSAYEWLDLSSQKALAARAKLSSSLAGRPFEPWDMLVPGRLSFATQSLTGRRLHARVDGQHATVELPIDKSYASASGNKVAMVHEAGRWRVDLGALGVH